MRGREGAVNQLSRLSPGVKSSHFERIVYVEGYNEGFAGEV